MSRNPNKPIAAFIGISYLAFTVYFAATCPLVEKWFKSTKVGKWVAR